MADAWKLQRIFQISNIFQIISSNKKTVCNENTRKKMQMENQNVQKKKK